MQLQLRIQLSWSVDFGTFFGSAISATTLNVQGSVSVTATVTATANVTATVTVTATGLPKMRGFPIKATRNDNFGNIVKTPARGQCEGNDQHVQKDHILANAC